jgi:hypothetical protein
MVGGLLKFGLILALVVPACEAPGGSLGPDGGGPDGPWEDSGATTGGTPSEVVDDLVDVWVSPDVPESPMTAGLPICSERMYLEGTRTCETLGCEWGGCSGGGAGGDGGAGGEGGEGGQSLRACPDELPVFRVEGNGWRGCGVLDVCKVSASEDADGKCCYFFTYHCR